MGQILSLWTYVPKSRGPLTYTTKSPKLFLAQAVPYSRCVPNQSTTEGRAVDVDVTMDRPYGLIWPLSAFSLGSLTRAASQHIGEPVRIQVVQLQEISEAAAVLPIRSDGFLKYLGQSDTPYVVSNQSWRPYGYELEASPILKMVIWRSPEGIVLSVERPNWPKGQMQLVRFAKFSDF